MKLGQKVFIISLFLFTGLAFFTRNTARGQTGPAALPREVLRPQYGEEPRFPRDYVIGELGRGDATEESYRLAREIVASLAAGDGKVARAIFPEQKRLAAVNKIKAVGARSWRVGGGRAEGAGGYSFLIRFLGRERSITGELYLQWEEPKPPVVEESPAAQTADAPADAPAETSTEQADDAAAETDITTAEEENPAEETAVAETETEEPVNVPAEPGATAVEFNIPAVPAGPPPTEAAPEDAVAKTTVTPAEEAAEEPRWRVDDILLESPRRLTDGKYSPGGADMTPYERFF